MGQIYIKYNITFSRNKALQRFLSSTYLHNNDSDLHFMLSICVILFQSCFLLISLFPLLESFSEASSFNNWHKLLSLCPAICPCPVNTICAYLMSVLIRYSWSDGAHLLDLLTYFFHVIIVPDM